MPGPSRSARTSWCITSIHHGTKPGPGPTRSGILSWTATPSRSPPLRTRAISTERWGDQFWSGPESIDRADRTREVMSHVLTYHELFIPMKVGRNDVEYASL